MIAVSKCCMDAPVVRDALAQQLALLGEDRHLLKTA
jgi:hypothetical protein